MKTKLLTILIITVILSACKKKSDDNSPVNETRIVKGKVEFPNDLNHSFVNNKLNSCFEEDILTDSEYEIEVSKDDFNTQFLTDDNGKDIMLGFTYPNQTDFTINSKSTLLALVMKLPAVNMLTTEGKLDFINKIQASTKYAEALQELELNITSGKDIFDTTTIALHKKIAALFDNASLRTMSGFGSEILMNRNDKQLTFTNPGNSYVQVIGIYNSNNVQIAKLELDRYKVFATSITGLVTATGNSATNPIEKTYTLPGDDTYKIKVRNGGFNTPNNDAESIEAANSNAINLVIDNLKVFLPIDVSSGGCSQAIYNAVKSKVTLYQTLVKQQNSKWGYLKIISAWTASTLDVIKVGIGCGNIPKPSLVNYIDKAKKYLKWLDFIGKWGTFMNNTTFAIQYFSHNSSIDTTLVIGDSTVTDIDGNIYHTVKIGTQTWLVENLKTTRYNDGVAIPNITDITQWYEYGTGTVNGNPNVEKAAWCYNNNIAGNNTIHGKLYNWHAVKTGKLAPTGWHVPTKIEWETLINYLGGSSVAGGKMKTTTLWNSPNIGASNSSGFSADPCGYRDNHGNFGGIGYFSGWWSSTQSTNNTNWAWNYYLENISSNVITDEGSKTPGLAIRCIKN